MTQCHGGSELNFCWQGKCPLDQFTESALAVASTLVTSRGSSSPSLEKNKNYGSCEATSVSKSTWEDSSVMDDRHWHFVVLDQYILASLLIWDVQSLDLSNVPSKMKHNISLTCSDNGLALLIKHRLVVFYILNWLLYRYTGTLLHRSLPVVS